jgi:hypothetical protein
MNDLSKFLIEETQKKIEDNNIEKFIIGFNIRLVSVGESFGLAWQIRLKLHGNNIFYFNINVPSGTLLKEIHLYQDYSKYLERIVILNTIN